MVKITHMATREVAEVLGITSQHVARLARTRELRAAIKLPGKTGPYLFDPRDVERYRAARASKAGHR